MKVKSVKSVNKKEKQVTKIATDIMAKALSQKITKEQFESAQQVIAEELAYHWLQKKGYKTLLKNYESPLGEVSLIAKDDGVLVFIWVNKYVNEKVATYYLKRYGINKMPTRFEIVSVSLVKDSEPVISIKYSQYLFDRVS